VARIGEKRGAYRVLVTKPEGRRPLGRPRHRWEDNVKMDFREVGWGDIEWIDLVEDKVRWRARVNAVMNLWQVTHFLLIFFADAPGQTDILSETVTVLL
jgi:hypothetical protein